MFVSIVNQYHHYRYDCDYVVTHTPELPVEPRNENEPDSFLLELFKNNVLMATHEINKVPEEAVYFMNDKGRTVDSLTW